LLQGAIHHLDAATRRYSSSWKD